MPGKGIKGRINSLDAFTSTPIASLYNVINQKQRYIVKNNFR